MNARETRAWRLIAQRRCVPRAKCVLVTVPKPRTSYFWADPVTRKIGTCRFGVKGWVLPPRSTTAVLFERPPRRRPVVDIIADLRALHLLDMAKAHCAGFRVPLNRVLGCSRESTLPQVRARLWGAIRLATGWTTPKLAELFGRDVSTIRAQIDRYYPKAMGTGKKCRRVKAVADQGIAA